MGENLKTDAACVYAITGEQDFSSQNNIGNQSTNNLVPVSSRGSLFEKRNTYRKLIILLIVCVTILLLAFVVLLVLYILNGSYNYAMCTSDECLRSAANLKLSMNLSIDPCEDFYKFTCGRWSQEHPNHGWFSHYSSFETADEHIAFISMRFFTSEESDNEPMPVKQSRYLYKSCMDTDSANKVGYSVIYDYLKIVGLPSVPSFFELQSNESYKFDWISSEAKIRKTFAMDTLIGFTVDANIYDRNETVIYLGRPSFTSQLPRYIRKNERVLQRNEKSQNENGVGEDEGLKDEHLQKSASVETVKIVIKSVVENVSVQNTTDDQINDAAELIWDLKYKTTELNEHNYTEEENLDYESFKVDDLQKLTEKCVADDKKNLVKDIWRKYLTIMFDDIENVTLDLDGNTLLYISYLEIDYLCDILSFVTNTSDDELELYFWWTIVDNMITSTTSDVAELLWKIIIDYDSEFVERPRSVDCASLAVNYMGIAVSYGIADIAALNFSKPKVNKMINNIKSAFLERVREITWMDEKTKRATVEKSKEMVSFIGYPEWFLKNGSLEEYYGNITIREDTYLENMMNIIKSYTPYRLSRLGKESIRQWRTDPTTVNAYNYFSDNSITVPMAILTFPFYNLGLEVLNYGAIGTILGHELTHGFDITGRKFDKYGNYKQWWSESTIETFLKSTNCFVKQYDNFTVPPLTKKVNGLKTLSENLADNGGFHHAYLAYQRHKEKHFSEKILPGLQHFSDDQLFFIAYGSIWCEEFNANTINRQLETDEHSPNYVRVTATLQNSLEFAKAFNCPTGSRMNPAQDKCRIW